MSHLSADVNTPEAQSGPDWVAHPPRPLWSRIWTNTRCFLPVTLLARLAASVVQPLQHINASALLVFKLPKFSHTAPFLCCNHLLVAAWTWFKSLVLAYRAVKGAAHPPFRTCSNHTPQPVHYAQRLPNGSPLPHYKEPPHQWGAGSPLISWEQKPQSENASSQMASWPIPLIYFYIIYVHYYISKSKQLAYFSLHFWVGYSRLNWHIALDKSKNVFQDTLAKCHNCMTIYAVVQP